jgi:hypothetical protein
VIVTLAPYNLARRVGDVLDAAIVPWAVGGSLASSVYGLPRSTADVDLIACLGPDHVEPVVRQLECAGYVDLDAVRAAVRASRSFNLIDDETMQKVDVFCVRGDRAGQVERSRRVEVSPGLVLPILCPEDVVVQKLRWFDLGGRTSDRQWRDVMEVLAVQGTAIDSELLAAQAEAAGISDLLRTALLG